MKFLFFCLVTAVLTCSSNGYAIDATTFGATRFEQSGLSCSMLLLEMRYLQAEQPFVLFSDALIGLEALDAQTKAQTGYAIEGVSNFRKIADTNFYGMAQISENGISNLLKQLGPHTRIVDLREEPTLFIDGKSFSIRLVQNPTPNLKLTGITSEQVEAAEQRLKQIVLQKLKASPVKALRELEYPAKNKESFELITLNTTSVATTSDAYKHAKSVGLGGNLLRVPMTDEEAPELIDFDAIIEIIKKDPASPIAFHCHAGHGRTTTALFAGLLVEQHISNDLSPIIKDAKPFQELMKFSAAKKILELLKMDDMNSARIEQANTQASLVLNMKADLIKKLNAAQTSNSSTKAVRAFSRFFSLVALEKYFTEHDAGRTTLPFSQWVQSQKKLYSALYLPELR